MRTGHMSAPRGKRVMVHMRDGSKIVGKFKKREDAWIHVDDQVIRTEKIRTISIYREK